MPLLSGSYDVVIRLLRGASPAFSRGASKVAVGLRGREGALDRLRSWAETGRVRGRPLIWLHAPSVGEGLQARVVLDTLNPLVPGLQSVFTHFSPSASALAERMPADVSTFLPWDVRSEMEDLLEALAPSVVAFTKTEVWPGLTAAAMERDVPVVLHSATLPPGAGRLRPWARPLLGPTFERLTRVLAISADDAGRLERLGVPSNRIEVTGDPAVDSAWRRARSVPANAPYLVPFLDHPVPIVVAGSTWEPDEKALSETMNVVRGSHEPGPTWLIAPHEPTEGHLKALEARLCQAGVTVDRLEEVEGKGAARPGSVVLVDRVGILAHLYTVGSIAYVGGGFHDDGLHSVLEPAAAGVPVVFGPNHGSSHAASELVSLGAAVSVAEAQGLARVVGGWLGDEERRVEAGTSAAAYVESHRGAAERTAQSLAALMAQQGKSSGG